MAGKENIDAPHVKSIRSCAGRTIANFTRPLRWPSAGEETMRHLVFALALLGVAATSARAQDAIPDLKGTWSGKGKSIVFGNNPHHPGSQAAADPPRVRDFEFTFVVDGQDGRLAWGHSLSTVASTNE